MLRVSLNTLFIIPSYFCYCRYHQQNCKAVSELKESSTCDNFNSELSKYEEYLKEETKNDISSPVNVSEKIQCLINKQNYTPIDPTDDHIIYASNYITSFCKFILANYN